MTFIILAIHALLIGSGLFSFATAASTPTFRPTVAVTAFTDLPIDLGAANKYAILAGTTVTSAGQTGTVVYGDIGLNPGSAVEGFPPAVCYGAIDGGSAAAGTAQGSLTTAYDEAAGRAPTAILTGQDLGGLTLAHGVYKFTSSASLIGDLTLNAFGDWNAVWVFQIASGLNIAQSSRVVFKDGIGNPDRVYWQMGSSATIKHNTAVVGNFMALQSISMDTGAVIVGRLLARNAAVTLDFNSVKIPDFLIFNSNITISGVTTITISINGQLAITTTAAECMEIAADFVEFLNAIATQTAQRRALRAHVDLLAAYDQNVLIRTKILLADTAYATTDEMYAALTQKLSDAVASGEFTNRLRANAVTFSAPELLAANGTDVTSNDPGLPGPSSDSDDKLSDGAIAGIVIGCVAFVVIVAFLIYFFCFHASASAAESTPTAVPASDL